ncbi:MAG: GspE/PulE family protein [Candidatus Paceibacterota bacterium]
MSTNFNEEKQEKKIKELHLKEAEELTRVLATKYNLPYIDLSITAVNTDALRLVPEDRAKEAKVATFKLLGKKVHLAQATPNNDKMKSIVKELTDKNFQVIQYLTSEESLRVAWARYQEIRRSEKTEAGTINISNKQIAKITDEISTINDVRERIEAESDIIQREGGISALLESVLSGGLAVSASDIHFEPEEEVIRLRYRLDGVLQDIAELPIKTYTQILARVKLVSGLKLNVKKAAQDGRFSIKTTEEEIEIRTSVIPSSYGESIVLRILNPKSIAVPFEDLGIEPFLFEIFKREINKPNGLILLTGPTGSGKTTTLYAFLRNVNSPEDKIITIEDPIEYHLKGINQTQVNVKADYTFLSGLRSALRQDPDIIMIGEIRDSETAKIAINAALTGHLVFSTLHTNNSAGAIPRLIDLGVNAKIISSALTLSIAQRLVRKLCPHCRQKSTPTEKEAGLIEQVREKILQKRPSIDLPVGKEIWRSGKCDECNNTGFKGRLGIFEAIAMDEKIAAIVTGNPNEKDIRLAAVEQNILDMREDGILKVLNGITAIEEVGRVVDLNEKFF